MRVFGAKAQTGRAWTYTAPPPTQPFDIDGIFDEAWATIGIQAVGRGAIAPVSTTKPALLVRLADLPSGVKPQQGDTLRNNVTGQTYSVADAQPDGMGCMHLILNETT